MNFGTASLIAGTATIYHPDWLASDWQLLLIFYAVCLGTFLICAFGNRLLPYVDAVASVWNGLTILIVCVALSVTANAGRHSVADALANYDKSFSGWGNFTFFIGLLPTAYTFSAIGMITSMAEEVADPARDVPTALSLVVPISGVAGLFFILPICFTVSHVLYQTILFFIFSSLLEAILSQLCLAKTANGAWYFAFSYSVFVRSHSCMIKSGYESAELTSL